MGIFFTAFDYFEFWKIDLEIHFGADRWDYLIFGWGTHSVAYCSDYFTIDWEADWRDFDLLVFEEWRKLQETNERYSKL